MASEQLVKDCAKSINIRCACELRFVTGGLLGRHVTWSAKYLQRARDSTLYFHQPRQPEIGQMRFAFCVEQNIARLNVTMQDTVLMGMMKRVRQLCH